MKKIVLTAFMATFVIGPVHAAKPDHANGNSLPPGLQKKVDRGGSLPPGWQRKLNKGSVLDKRVYDAASPVDDSMQVQLPAGPNGTIDLRVEGKIVRIYQATRIILDVFDIR